MLDLKRRNLISSLGAASLMATSIGHEAIADEGQVNSPKSNQLPPIDSKNIEKDSNYWSQVKKMYTVSPQVINLENGYWGIMTDQVRLQFQAHVERVNTENSHYARGQFFADAENARKMVAQQVGASTEEISLTRGATEAMQLLIGGFNRLSPGDFVAYCDLDYDSMQYSMNWLVKRRGVQVVKFNIPEPASWENILATYERVFLQNPKIKLLLLTHISHRTGLLMPVKEITEIAKKFGATVILDAAHSWGQIDFKIGDIGVDFAGFNLHKWIGAPLGIGFLYIKKERLSEMDTAMSDQDWPVTDIRSRVHSGTTNFATVLTVPLALSVHQHIGPKAKEMRLKYLRNYWVQQVQKISKIEVLTPNDPQLSAGITSFRIKGKTTAPDNNALVSELLNKYGIFSVRRGGLASGHCVRISPALYNDEEQLDRLTEALKTIAAQVI